jgi:demethylmenaquinone methyltransferase / 2-methoxy-6-polyprenyl-1,4-benzoquinol methylase
MSPYTKEKPHTIQAMFNAIAHRYDKTNSVLSFQLHKRWNKQLINHVLKANSLSPFLDLCCGTGDIAYEFLRHSPSPCQAYLVDFSEEMLLCAREKYTLLDTPHQIDFIQADVMQIPLPSNIIGCATMAYGIRNVKDPSQAIAEAFRVLKQEGSFGILELTQPSNPLLAWLHRLYLRSFTPLFGKWLTKNEDAYKYLQNSIESFIAPEEVEKKLQQAGFVDTKCRPLMGGIATLITGRKP